MKLKNFLLGAGLVLGGAAFGQSDASNPDDPIDPSDYKVEHIYVPDYDITLKVDKCEITTDADAGVTTFNINVISSNPGNPNMPPDARPYLAAVGGYVGPWGSTIKCFEQPAMQCVWTW
jgi:hypothetical protein